MQEKPESIGYEPYFLGPKSENENWVREQIKSTLDHWFQWRKSLFASDPNAISSDQIAHPQYTKKQTAMSKGLEELNHKLNAETPKFTPRYIGHMVSEISLPSILGHISALLHNPNITSSEAAKVGCQIEEEAITMLLDMIGYDTVLGTGHFTSGGTVANLEAIWRARFRMDHWQSLSLYLTINHKTAFDIFENSMMGWDKYNQLFNSYKPNDKQLRECSLAASNPWKTATLINKHSQDDYGGPILLVPANKHYSWIKGCNIFGFGEEALWSVPLDQQGQIDCSELEKLIFKAKDENRPILMVVSVAGTTETGIIDPINEVQDLLDEIKNKKGWNIWHHVDAAYGGFICNLLHNPTVAKTIFSKDRLKSLKAIARSDSVTIDPHKLGYTPYSCGAILFPNQRNYVTSDFSAPYLDRDNLELPKWSSTLEGSRSASGASATWLTGKVIGFKSDDFSQIIANTFNACEKFKKFLCEQVDWIQPLPVTETNILCFSIGKKGDSLTQANQKTEVIYNALAKSPNFSVSKTVLDITNYSKLISNHCHGFSGALDCNSLILIRCVFMNPFWSSEDLSHKLKNEFLSEVSDNYNKLNTQL